MSDDGKKRAPKRRGGRRRALRLVLIAGGLVVLLGAGLLTAAWAALHVQGGGTPSAAAVSTGQDAEWLGHAWVDGRKTEADVAALAAQLRGTGVRHLFIHAGPLAEDGSLDPALHAKARWAVDALHAAIPGVRVQAWLGQVVGPGRMDLSDDGTQRRILASAQQVLGEGFDGVHYDFEPVRSGDAGLLEVLDGTRAITKARGALLSVAASQLEEAPRVAWVIGLLPIPAGVWTDDYLGQVARRVDQVALMAYDSGVPTPRAYSGWVRRQTRTALEVVPPEVHLFIGTPAYHDGTLTHRPGAETVAASLRGVRLGLGATPPRRPFGVAVYVDFTATEEDWRSYRSGWAAP